MDKKILDVTCGARTIWFDKAHPAAVYCDKRREAYHNLWKHAGNCSLNIDPDVLCDFTELPFPDAFFSLVVFDPPHLTGAKDTAWLVKKYGKLDDTWPQMLHDGFRECMRVLKPDGVLIFKWSEYNIPAEKVWKAIGEKPLFGHHSGKQSRTFWGCFMKFDNENLKEILVGQPTIDPVHAAGGCYCRECTKQNTKRCPIISVQWGTLTQPERYHTLMPEDGYCSHGELRKGE